MSGKWYFLVGVAFIYLIMLIFSPTITMNSVSVSLKMLYRILPALVFVFIIMLLVNLYVKGEKVKKYLGNSKGARKWLISVGSGVISMGPIYAWYPLLKDLHKKGASFGFVSAFLYARSVKPFLIPVMIVYFGVLYTVLLSVLMLTGAFLQGLLFEKIEKWL